jgi:hypothetical protein
MTDKPTKKIATLNDAARKGVGVRVVITQGIDAMSVVDKAVIRDRVTTFDTFDDDNDPHGEHDFGAFDYKGKTIFFKIDYYDKNLEMGSEDPSNPDVTRRVLTIMLASEY